MSHKTIKLTPPGSTPVVFENNQVLTALQLNSNHAFLDEQVRLSRLHLSGAGIITGLEAYVDNDRILIKAGKALTTDGDLITFQEDMILTQIRAYEPSKMSYQRFQNLMSSKPLEVFPASSTLSDLEPISNVNLAGKVVFLLQENYTHDENECSVENCDNLGLHEVRNIRFVLFDESEARTLIDDQPTSNRITQLNKLNKPRIILNNVDGVADLNTAFKNVSNEDLIKQIAEGLQEVDEIIQELAEEKQDRFDYLELISKNLDTADGENKAQIKHQHLGDVIDAYHAIRALLQESVAFKHIRVNDFPKHLSLGELIPADNQGVVGEMTAMNDALRHQFSQSPALNNNQDQLLELRFRIHGVRKMIELFEIPEGSIRITPSKKKEHTELSERAMPYYYQPEMHLFWSYEKTRAQKSNTVLSYNAEKYAASNDATTAKPLEGEIEGYDFYRIEGIYGKSLDEVEAELEPLMIANNLPFKLLHLSVDREIRFVRPKYFNPYLSLFHKVYAKEVLHDIESVKQYNTSIKEKIDNDEKIASVQSDSAAQVALQSYAAGQVSGLATRISEVQSHLTKGINAYDRVALKSDYDGFLTSTGVFNKNVKKITRASSFTPLEKITSNIKINILDYLKNYHDKQREKTDERFILSNFIEVVPGLQPGGGVPEGGTYVVVSDSSNQRVVADFYLPFMFHETLAFEPEVEDDEVEILPLPIDPIKPWGTYNDLNISLITPELIEAKYIQTMDFNVSMVNKIKPESFTVQEAQNNQDVLNSAADNILAYNYLSISADSGIEILPTTFNPIILDGQ